MPKPEPRPLRTLPERAFRARARRYASRAAGRQQQLLDPAGLPA